MHARTHKPTYPYTRTHRYTHEPGPVRSIIPLTSVPPLSLLPSCPCAPIVFQGKMGPMRPPQGRNLTTAEARINSDGDKRTSRDLERRTKPKSKSKTNLPASPRKAKSASAESRVSTAATIAPAAAADTLAAEAAVAERSHHIAPTGEKKRGRSPGKLSGGEGHTKKMKPPRTLKHKVWYHMVVSIPRLWNQSSSRSK